MTGNEYLKNRKGELHGHGRVAEILSASEGVTIALVHEAYSKIGAHIAALESKIARLEQELAKKASPEDIQDNLRRAEIGGAHDPRNDRED